MDEDGGSEINSQARDGAGDGAGTGADDLGAVLSSPPSPSEHLVKASSRVVSYSGQVRLCDLMGSIELCACELLVCISLQSPFQRINLN